MGQTEADVGSESTALQGNQGECSVGGGEGGDGFKRPGQRTHGEEQLAKQLRTRGRERSVLGRGRSPCKGSGRGVPGRPEEEQEARAAEEQVGGAVGDQVTEAVTGVRARQAFGFARGKRGPLQV